MRWEKLARDTTRPAVWDAETATRTFSALLGASGCALLVDQFLVIVAPGRFTVQALHLMLFGVALVTIGIAAWCYRTRARRGVVGLRGAMIATTVLSTIHWAARDTSPGSFMFHIFPVVFLAYHRQTRDALIEAFYASFTTTVVAFSLQPFADAIHNSLYCPVVLITVAYLMSALREAQAEAQHLLELAASVDPLTGLATRKVFDDHAGEALRTNPAGVSLVLVDVDHFKMINDSYGHPVGDAVLREVASLIRTMSRTEDVACRLGGDEMALLLPAADEQDARGRAEELVRRVAAQPHHITIGTITHQVPVQVSVGVAHAPRGSTLAHLYSVADASLYTAKRGGRGQVGGARAEDVPAGSIASSHQISHLN